MEYRIRELRKSRKWTIEQLAEIAGVSKGYVSLLENGERVPSASMLQTLAAAFNVSDTDLIVTTSDKDYEMEELIRRYSSLSESDKSAVSHLVKSLSGDKDG